MKFLLNGTTYQVDFSYGKEEVKTRKGVVTRRITIASLNVLNDDNSYSVSINATASCSEKDRFSKDTGRKLALARLVKDMLADVKTQEYKNMSAFIWYVYFTRSGEGILEYNPDVNYRSYIYEGFKNAKEALREEL